MLVADQVDTPKLIELFKFLFEWLQPELELFIYVLTFSL